MLCKKKPLNTLLMMLGSMHDVGLIGMLVMVFLWCTLNSYLLLMVLVMLMSKKIKDFFFIFYGVLDSWILSSFKCFCLYLYGKGFGHCFVFQMFLFVDTTCIKNIISSHSVTEVSAILFKYLLFSQAHVLGF